MLTIAVAEQYSYSVLSSAGESVFSETCRIVLHFIIYIGLVGFSIPLSQSYTSNLRLVIITKTSK